MEVIGLNTVITSLGIAGSRAKSDAQKAVEESIADIESTMRSLAPRDEGDLVDSIESEVMDEAGKVVGEVGPTVYYARFIEYGTVRMGPQAFAGPALDRHGPDFVKKIEDLGGKLL